MAFNILILLIAPPFFIGVIERVKSLFAGRIGPPLFQPYFDIIKLLRKDSVYSQSSSFIFQMSPLCILMAVIFAGLCLPLSGKAVISFEGDIILFIYLFALSRFLIIASALDVGSSFEGMGGSREAILGAFSELTVFAGLVTLAIISRSMTLSEIFQPHGGFQEPSLLFLFAGFFFILLTENSRMPIDDPKTHLELTMIHEVMILDNSGKDLGIILYASSIKLFIFMIFAASTLLPNGNFGSLQSSALTLVKVLFVSILIGIVESLTARVKMVKIPHLLTACFVMTVFALLIALFERGML